MYPMGSYTNLDQKNKFYKFSDFFDPNRDFENHIYVKVGKTTES